MKRTNIFLSEQQIARLGAISEQEGLSVAEIIRRAVDAWLDSRGVAQMPLGKDLGREEVFSPEKVLADVMDEYARRLRSDALAAGMTKEKARPEETEPGRGSEAEG